MAQLISNVLMQPKPTDAVERPMTLIEKLEQERTRLNKQANDDIDVVSKENHAYQVGLIGGLTNAIDIVKQNGDWISVDERLPSDGVKVLTWHPRKEKFFIASFDKELNLWLENGSPCSSNFLYSITHWRELPQPPSEVQDD